MPSPSPTNTRPLATAGDDSPIALLVEYFHFSLPVVSSSAIRSPVNAPTYTTPSTIAADESMASPASYFHSSFNAGPGADGATPVSTGFPRNCGHESAVGACACGDTDPRRITAPVRMPDTTPR